MMDSGGTLAKGFHWLARRRGLLAGSVLALVLLLAAACGGGDDEETTATTTSTDSGSTAAAQTTTGTTTTAATTTASTASTQTSTTAASTTASTTTTDTAAPAAEIDPKFGGHLNRIAPYIVRGVDPGTSTTGARPQGALSRRATTGSSTTSGPSARSGELSTFPAWPSPGKWMMPGRRGRSSWRKVSSSTTPPHTRSSPAART